MKHFVSALCVLFVFSSVILAQEPDWNHFRGPKRDNHSFSTGIAKSWSEGGPKLLWKIDTLGDGYSNLCFFGDTIYTMGDFGDRTFVLALNRETREIKWKTDIGRGVGRDFPGPRCTPACDGDAVYAIGRYGEFAALDAKDGTVRWRKNFPEELGGRFTGNWGFAMSPLIDGERIVIPVGGEGGAVIAFDKSGKILWRTAAIPNPVGYSSVVPVEIEGIRQYVILTGGTEERKAVLAGISPTDGKILWGAHFPDGDRVPTPAICSDPVLCGDVIMASASYGVGTVYYRITKEGDTFKAFDFNGNRELQSHHGGIVAVGDHFYLLTNNQMTCIEAKTGNVVWENRSVGKGSLTYVDGVLILRSERGDGTIAMIEATPTGYKELGRFDQPDRSDKNSWTYPVVVDKKLYIRDQNVLLCYDLN